MNSTSPDPSSNSAAESGRPTRGPTRPTERDYDLYRRHSVEFVSQSELAKEHGISQQRVSQVLRNVERWVASHPEDEEAQQVRHSAGDRWEAVIALSMRAFRKSQHDQEVTKQRTLVRGGTAEGTEPDVTSTIEKTVRSQCGDVRYLHAAMRAMEKQARLFPNGDIIPRVLAEPVVEAAEIDLEAIAEPEVEPLEEPIVEHVDSGAPPTLAKSTVAVEERSPVARRTEPASPPTELPPGRTQASEPRPIITLTVGPVPDPRKPATASRIDSPHKHGSRRQRRRQQAQRRAERPPANLDIGRSASGQPENLSICRSSSGSGSPRPQS